MGFIYFVKKKFFYHKMYITQNNYTIIKNTNAKNKKINRVSGFLFYLFLNKFYR